MDSDEKRMLITLSLKTADRMSQISQAMIELIDIMGERDKIDPREIDLIDRVCALCEPPSEVAQLTQLGMDRRGLQNRT